MRRLLTFIIVVILGAASFTGISVAADEIVDEAWANVAEPTRGAPLSLLDDLVATLNGLGEEGLAKTVDGARESLIAQNGPSNSGYVVSFLQPLAHVPEMVTDGAPEVEWMAVYVRSGEFVLDNMSSTPFYVVPGDARDSIYTFDIELTDGGAVAHYTLNEKVACATICPVTPPGAVQVLEDDWILAEADQLCVWCLLNQNAHAGQTTGILYVYPVLEGSPFTWVTAWEQANSGTLPTGTPVPATPSATPAAALTDDSGNAGAIEPLSNVMAWAWFNPAPNCRGG